MQKPLMSASATDQLINVPAHLAAEAYMTAARAARTLSRQVSNESALLPPVAGRQEGQPPPQACRCSQLDADTGGAAGQLAWVMIPYSWILR
jgi:hypothetical protein